MIGFWGLLFVVVFAMFGPLIIGVTINVLDALFFPKKEGKEDTDGEE